MKKFLLFVFLQLTFLPTFSQSGFQFMSHQNKIEIPFQLSNNLVIFPIELNGVKLNFLLDTGVEKTILFSLEDTDYLQFNYVEKIKVRGLGEGKSIDALHSKKNKIAISDLVDKDHEVYIILDDELNFSSQLGIPVHGIIGYHFFKNHFIEINYKRKKLIIYKNKESFPSKRLRKFDEIPISIEIEKPYLEAIANINSTEIPVKLLVDMGGSSALWLFENKKNIESPQNFFQDFLGRGFSGNIYGKRSRIDKFKIGKQELHFPTTSFPDTLSLQSVNMVEGRNGSVGSEILRRFDVLFDYANKKMYLKSNSDIHEPFNYNMSGIEVQHDGVQLVKEEVGLKTKFVTVKNSVFEPESFSVKYNFELKPVYKVATIRPNSPAALAGIVEGDVIKKINGTSAYKFKLDQIKHLLQSEEDRWITIEVKRTGYDLKIKFQLKKIL